MADISDKLTYLNETKGLIKKGLNDLGADLTDASSFRSYANVLSGMYDDYPKVTGEGIDLSLSPTKQGKLAITPKGASSQKSTEGKSLVKINNATINGITYTNNDDDTGSIILNNSNTAAVTFYKNVTLSVGTYYLNYGYINGTVTTEGNTYFQILVYPSSGGTQIAGLNITSTIYQENRNSSFTLSEETSVQIRVYIGSTVRNFNNFNFNFMLTKDSYSYDWEPYTNGAAPNPDYPFPVKSVTGENSVSISQQVIPSEYTQVDYLSSDGNQYIKTNVIGQSGIRTVSDFELLEFPSKNTPLCGCYKNNKRCYLGIVKPDGTLGASYISTSWSSTTISLNKKYNLDIIFNTNSQIMRLDGVDILTGTNSNELNTENKIVLFGYAADSGSLDTNFPIKLKLYNYKIYQDDVLIGNFIPCIRNSDRKTGMYDIVNDVFYPCLKADAETGEFEYGYSQTYTINLGKNLFDGTYEHTYTAGSSPYLYTASNTSRSGVIKVNPNTVYTISKELSNRFRISQYTERPVAGTTNAISYIQAGDSNLTYTLTTESTTQYLVVQVSYESQENIKMQVELGSTATEYASYFTPIELNSSPDGTIRDEIVGSSAISYNLFDKDLFETFDSNTIKSIELQLNPNTQYTMSSNLPTYDNYSNIFFKLSGESYGTEQNGVTPNKSVTLTTGNDGIAIIGYRNNAGSLSGDLANDYWYQITEGSEAKPYFPYGQVGMWWKREYIKKMNLTDFSWSLFNDTHTNNIGFRSGTLPQSLKDGNLLCYNLKSYDAPTLWNADGVNGIAYSTTGNYLAIFILRSYLSEQTIGAFNSWIENNPSYLYGALTTPVDIPITDATLISQLNDLYDNGRSYDGITNITSTYENGNEQMIIYAEALMDISDSTKVKINEENLTNIANTLRTRNRTTALYTPAQMPAAIETVGDMGDISNGIIEEYLTTSDTIDANTFVEFVNTNDYTLSTDTELSSSYYSYAYARAVKLNDTKVFIVHNSNTDTMGLNGMVCEINGDTITHGADTVLSAAYASSSFASPVAIDENTVFISHSAGGDNPGLNGIVCTISGLVITPGTDTVLVSTVNSYYSSYATPIFETRAGWVLVTHMSDENNYYLNGIICHISGTTITHNTDTTLLSTMGSYTNAKAVEIMGGEVFIAHPKGTKLNGFICSVSTINGGDLYPYADTEINATSGSWNNSNLLKLDSSRVLIAHANNNDNAYLNAIVCGVSGGVITPGTDAQLEAATGASNGSYPVLLEEDKVFIAHGDSYFDGRLKAAICTISGTTITLVLNDVIDSDVSSINEVNPVVLDDTTVFISHCTGGDGHYMSLTLSGLIYKIAKKIKIAEDSIDGMTKEECSSTTAGDVWVLEPYVEVNPEDLM